MLRWVPRLYWLGARTGAVPTLNVVPMWVPIEVRGKGLVPRLHVGTVPVQVLYTLWVSSTRTGTARTPVWCIEPPPAVHSAV